MRSHIWRLDRRALIGSLALIVLVGAAFFALSFRQTGRVRREVLAQANHLVAAGKMDTAIAHLGQYLQTRPDDPEALALQARLLAEAAQGPEQIQMAAGLNARLLNLQPDAPDSQAVRLRLVELYVRFSDLHRASTVFRTTPEVAAHMLRYRVAATVARELVKRDGKPAENHRALALALEGLAVPGDEASLAEAIHEYEVALEGNPRDVLSAGRLAGLCLDRLKDPARSLRVLDDLVRALPDSVEPRLVRYQHFAKRGKPELARAELAEAAKLAPKDATVRLTAALDDVRRGDTSDARLQIDAIPADSRVGLKVKMVQGLIAMGEDHPDEAVDGWKKGLLTVDGTDAEMTWWLAYALLQMNRVSEAKPLISQYCRLIGDETHPLAQLLRAITDERLNRPLPAILVLERLVERLDDPWQVIVNTALGHCYEAIWDESKALASYRKSLEFEPSAVLPRLAIARLLLDRKPDEAITELQGGLAEAGEEPSLMIAVAGALLKRQEQLPSGRRNWGDFDKALRKVAELAPNSPAVAMMQADRLTLSGNLEDAVSLLGKATVQSPGNASLWIALATGLDRIGKRDEAIASIRRASAPDAVGDRANFRIALARLLVASGRGREGREQLVREIGKLPVAERPAVWQESGRLLAEVGDLAGARESYEEWARIQPESPGPRLAMLDLALVHDDEPAIRATVAALKDLGGPKDITWRLSRTLGLLRLSPPEGQGEKAREAVLNEATTLVEGVLEDAPEMPSAHLFMGEILERRGLTDRAVDSYQKAWDRGQVAALPRLVSLLAKLGRTEDLARLKSSGAGARLDELAATAYLLSGDASKAGEYVREAGRDASDSPAVREWQVKMLAALGKRNEAEALLKARSEAQAGAELPLFQLLRFQVENGRREESKATYSQIKAKVKSDRPDYLEARCRWIMGDWKAADAAYAKAVAKAADDPEVLLSAASYAQATGRPADAIDRLRKVLAKHPENRLATRQLAILLSEIEGDPQAWEQAWEAVGPAPKGVESPDDRLVRSVVLSRCPDQSKRAPAVAQLADLIADLPPSQEVAVAARDYLARILIRDGDAERACRVASVSASVDSPTASDLSLYIEALLLAKDYAQAAKQLDRLEVLTPDDASEATLRVRLLTLRSGPKEAIADLERAVTGRLKAGKAGALGRQAFRQLVELGPPARATAGRLAVQLAEADPSLSWCVARAHLWANEWDKALKAARLTTDAAPATKADLLETARIAMDVANASPDEALRDQAATLLEAARRRDPDDIALNILSAMIAHLRKQYEDEARFYRDVLAAQPGNAIALNNLAWTLSEGLGRPSEGIVYIDELLRNSGRVPQALGTRGVILIRLGRFSGAIEDLEEATKASPTALNQYYLALAYHKAGHEERSREALALARKAGLTLAEIDAPQKPEAEEFLKP